jgi:hypothetical protein
MLVEEVEGLLLGRFPLEEFAEGPQSIDAVGEGESASPLEGFPVVPMSQAQQPQQDPHPLDSSGFQHIFGPAGGVFADQPHPPQEILRSPLDAAALLRGDVRIVRAEPPRLLT